MKKLISVIAAICLLCSFSTLSFADYTVPVTASISAGTFSVTVPTSIAITDSTNGKQQSYQISNTGNLPVKISEITVTPNTGWSKVTGNFTAYKQFKLDIDGKDNTIPVGSSGTYNYTASIPTNQPTSVNEQIATVVFTISVDESTFTPINPVAVTPTSVKYNCVYFYKIAIYGDYSLLILQTPITSESISDVPSGVGVNLNGNDGISLPGGEFTAPFDLSPAEYNAYCSNHTITNTESSYQLRDGRYISGNSLSLDTQTVSNHRYAIWVPTANITPPA